MIGLDLLAMEQSLLTPLALSSICSYYYHEYYLIMNTTRSLPPSGRAIFIVNCCLLCSGTKITVIPISPVPSPNQSEIDDIDTFAIWFSFTLDN